MNPIQPKENDVQRIFKVATTALFLTAATLPALAASMDMPAVRKPNTMASVTDFRFTLAGPPKSAGSGTSIVSIKLLRGDKPVVGAIIIRSRADMGPIGMAAMTAPIKPLGEQPAGTYRFEIQNGSVWRKPDNWSLSFSAKVQGVTQTVSGSVTVKLTP
jgi:hypothetical protein